MASTSAPLVGAGGSASREIALDENVFAADIRPHLVHEAVRAEMNASRAATRGVKTRGLVAGGRSKPWRQKGTGRARQGTIRAPQFEGGGVTFLPRTQFEVKVNRKVRRAAMASALSDHAQAGTLGILDPAFVEVPSTKGAVALLEGWNHELPLLVVVSEDDDNVVKSFRNLQRVLVVTPSEVEVSQLVWARAVLVSERALDDLQRRAAK